MEEPVAVANFRTKMEAEIAAAALDEEGIPYLIQSQEGMLYGPLYPGATLYVPAADAARAREIIPDGFLIPEEGSG